MEKNDKVRLSKNLRAARDAAGLSNTDLADACGVTVQAVGGWLKTGKISRESLVLFAKAVGRSVDSLLTGEETIFEAGPDVGAYSVAPIVGTAQLGPDGFWSELEYPVGHGDGVIDVPLKDKNAYALRVRGDSMAPAIRDGWFVVVEPARTPNPGEYVLITTHDGRSMVKELLWVREDQVSLMSVNDSYARITLPISAIDKIHAVSFIAPPSKRRLT